MLRIVAVLWRRGSRRGGSWHRQRDTECWAQSHHPLAGRGSEGQGFEADAWVRDKMIAPIFKGHWDFYSNGDHCRFRWRSSPKDTGGIWLLNSRGFVCISYNFTHCGSRFQSPSQVPWTFVTQELNLHHRVDGWLWIVSRSHCTGCWSVEEQAEEQPWTWSLEQLAIQSYVWHGTRVHKTILAKMTFYCGYLCNWFW